MAQKILLPGRPALNPTSSPPWCRPSMTALLCALVLCAIPRVWAHAAESFRSDAEPILAASNTDTGSRTSPVVGVQPSEGAECRPPDTDVCMSGCKADGAQAGDVCLGHFVECINTCQWDQNGDGRVSASEYDVHRACASPCQTRRQNCLGEAYRRQQACARKCHCAEDAGSENSV